MIPIEKLQEDGLSPCAYHRNNIRNTLTLPKQNETQVLQGWK